MKRETEDSSHHDWSGITFGSRNMFDIFGLSGGFYNNNNLRNKEEFSPPTKNPTLPTSIGRVVEIIPWQCQCNKLLVSCQCCYGISKYKTRWILKRFEKQTTTRTTTTSRNAQLQYPNITIILQNESLHSTTTTTIIIIIIIIIIIGCHHTRTFQISSIHLGPNS